MDKIELITNRLSKTNHRAVIAQAIFNCRKQLRCFMPFISQEGIKFIRESLQNRAFRIDKIRIRLLICDSPQAYRSGALDANALLEFSEQNDAEIVAFGEGLHAKVLLIDSSIAIVTSANLTHGGLRGNLEIGFKITDEEMIEKVSNEFEIAWDSADRLTSKELKDRIEWSNKFIEKEKDEKETFRKKVRWRPVETSGTGAIYGTEIFEGFKKDDFEVIDPKHYGGSFHDDHINVEVVDKIKEAIEKQTKPLLSKFYLSVKDYLPRDEFLYPHYASRRRVRIFIQVPLGWASGGTKGDT